MDWWLYAQPGLAAESARDIWAVGSAATGKPLIERWNGRAWKQVRLAAAFDHFKPGLGDVAMVLAFTGLRWEEAAAVPVSNVNPHAQWMIIDRTASESGGRHDIREDMMTRAAVRTVMIPDIAMPAIRRLVERDSRDADRSQMGHSRIETPKNGYGHLFASVVVRVSRVGVMDAGVAVTVAVSTFAAGSLLERYEIMSMSTAELEAFLAQTFPTPLGVIATLRHDGSPHIVPVWFRWNAGIVTIWTTEARAWVQNLLRDPRAAFSVQTFDEPYPAVTMRGSATVATADDAATDDEIRAITRRYIVPAEVENYIARWPDLHTIVTIIPVRIASWSETAEI